MMASPSTVAVSSLTAGGCLRIDERDIDQMMLLSPLSAVKVRGVVGGIPIPLKNIQVFSTPGTPQFQLFLAKDPSAAINRDNGYSFDMVAPSPEERDRFIEEVNRLKRADASRPSHAPNQTPSGDSDRSCGGDGCVVC